MRQIVLDTETTGISIKDGNKLIEIGCVELENRRFTGRTYHQYINPQRESEEGALRIHGLTSEFLADKPLFADIAEEFCQFIDGAELIIHNAPFDIGFLEHELKLAGSPFVPISNFCKITDSLVLAKARHPGAKNSLDALCKRYGVDNSHRELHGALLDSEILADVYLLLTGGQKGLQLGGDEDEQGTTVEAVKRLDSSIDLPIICADENANMAHNEYLDFLEKKSGNSIWRQ